jgi:hypothetical protein
MCPKRPRLWTWRAIQSGEATARSASPTMTPATTFASAVSVSPGVKSTFPGL